MMGLASLILTANGVMSLPHWASSARGGSTSSSGTVPAPGSYHIGRDGDLLSPYVAGIYLRYGLTVPPLRSEFSE